jgi:4-carboxymuconolactone decarboxylase
MRISETACKNHDKLFPGHVSTLAVTDPELIEVFDNFAFDADATRRSRAMSPRTSMLAMTAHG